MAIRSAQIAAIVAMVSAVRSIASIRATRSWAFRSSVAAWSWRSIFPRVSLSFVIDTLVRATVIGDGVRGSAQPCRFPPPPRDIGRHPSANLVEVQVLSSAYGVSRESGNAGNKPQQAMSPRGFAGGKSPEGRGRGHVLSLNDQGDRSERKHASRSSGSRASNRCSCFSWRGETIPPQAPHPLLNSRSAHFEAWAIACPNHSFGVGGLAHSGRSSEPRRLGGCEPVPQMARSKDGGSEASTRAGGG